MSINDNLWERMTIWICDLLMELGSVNLRWKLHFVIGVVICIAWWLMLDVIFTVLFWICSWFTGRGSNISTPLSCQSATDSKWYCKCFVSCIFMRLFPRSVQNFHSRKQSAHFQEICRTWWTREIFQTYYCRK